MMKILFLALVTLYFHLYSFAPVNGSAAKVLVVDDNDEYDIKQESTNINIFEDEHEDSPPQEFDNDFEDGDRFVLSDFQKFSESHLWDLMLSFYDQKGPNSWAENIVPNVITSNPFIAKCYAKLLQGFIRDTVSKDSKIKLDETKPLYIIEFGAGPGKFTFHLLHALSEMKKVIDFPYKNIKYVMTDFADSNFNFWLRHPALKPYFDSGILDAAKFNLLQSDSITLWKSGTVIGPGTSDNPVIVIANYVFDTLNSDTFRVDNGELYEGYISVGSKRRFESNPLDPEIILRMDNRFDYYPVTVDSVYDKEKQDEQIHLERTLRWYVDYFAEDNEGASFLFPISGFRILSHVASFSKANTALVLSADRATVTADEFRGFFNPDLGLHGSFSILVNYHAMDTWVASRGGFALTEAQEDNPLTTNAFLLTPQHFFDDNVDDDNFLGAQVKAVNQARASHFPNLQQSFADFVDSFGPTDFHTMHLLPFPFQLDIDNDFNPPFKTLITLLKLSDWDPEVFFRFLDDINEQILTCSPKLLHDFLRGLPKLAGNYFYLDPKRDLPFEIGNILFELKDFKSAVNYFKQSFEYNNRSSANAFNQGLCYYYLENYELSMDFFDTAIRLDSNNEDARTWIDILQRTEGFTRKKLKPRKPTPKSANVNAGRDDL